MEIGPSGDWTVWVNESQDRPKEGLQANEVVQIGASGQLERTRHAEHAARNVHIRRVSSMVETGSTSRTSHGTTQSVDVTVYLVALGLAILGSTLYVILIIGVFFNERRKLRRQQNPDPAGVPEEVDPLQVGWDHFHSTPKFFKTLDIAEDGGFAEVPSLFTKSRWFWALVSCIVITMNMYVLVAPNFLMLIKENWWEDVAGASSLPLMLNSLAAHLGKREMRAKMLVAAL